MKKLLLVSILLFGLISPPLQAFSDVPASYPSQPAIDYLLSKGIIKGYEDGSFRPDQFINRAEFLKIAMASAPGSSEQISVACFPDVPADAWFAPFVCAAKESSYIAGYNDGTFKPSQTITLVEAAKIIATVHHQELQETTDLNWYTPFLLTLTEKKTIPDSFHYLNQKVSRAQMAEIIWRLLENKTDQPSVTFTALEGQFCQYFTNNLPPNINIETVRQTWLSWLNEERAKQGLTPYIYNPLLNHTATEWSEFSAARGYIDHKRPGTTAYYDYNAITSWFRSFGLEFQNINSVTHTENIGWDVYQCSQEDCSEYALSKARNVFDFYMREKGRAYSPHYDSVMNKYFTEIGFGVAVSGGKVFFTTHYGTKIISNPLSVCE